MLVRDAIFTAIDFESAGAARGQTDTPIQIGISRWSVAGGHHQSFVSYLWTDQPVLWTAQKVHGITTSHLAEAPDLLSLWPEVKSRLAGAVVVAHGKGTEKKFLRAFPGHDFGPWLDTLLLARATWPHLSDHSLGHLCDSQNVTDAIESLIPSKTWHDALFDATASLVLLARIIHLFQLEDKPLDFLLHPDTSVWHRHKRC